VERKVPYGGQTSVNDQSNSHARIWISKLDTVGNVVDGRLIEAAHRVWERARLVVFRYLLDDTEAPEILEAAVDKASRAMTGNHQEIQSFETYLLRSVARESVRRMRRNRRIKYVDGANLERLAGAVFTNPERELDEAKRIQLFRACMDDLGRFMYDLRVLDFKWRRIAKLTGYTDAHSAEVGFRKKMDRALERFQGLS